MAEKALTAFFEVLGSQPGIEAAKLLTALVLPMEYQGLLEGADRLRRESRLALIKGFMLLLMGL